MTPKINDTRTNPETGIRERWNGQFWERIDAGSINEPSKKNKNPGTKPPVKEDSKPVTPNVTQTRETRTQIPRTIDPEPSGLGKIIAVILVIAAIVGIVVAISSIPAPLGSAENPYLIYDGEDLQNIICGDDSVHYALANDIDLSGYDNWEPIYYPKKVIFGYKLYYFEGVLDGRGHTITGLKCTDDFNSGLFRELHGTVKNLNIKDAYIVAEGGSGAGIIAGSSYKPTISNCDISGTVTGSAGDIGGIIGYNNGGNIISSSFTGTVFGYSNAVGGITGGNSGGLISDSSFKGTVTSDVNGGGYVSDERSTGGIAGWVDGVVQDCHVSGSVTGNGHVGGIAGLVDGGKVINCKSSGSVMANILSDDYYTPPRLSALAGGIVGYLKGPNENYIGTVQGCTSSASVSAEMIRGSHSSADRSETGQIVAEIGDYAKVI